MSSSPGERRQHPRYRATVPVELRIELHGFGSAESRFVARGHTLNISRGGMLALVDRELEPGTRCVAHFTEASQRVGRSMIFGSVRRSFRTDGGHEVAVFFDTPLQRLPVDPEDPESATPEPAEPGAGPAPEDPPGDS